MDGLLIALVVAALVIGGLLMLFIQLTSKRTEKLDRELYRKVWQAVQRVADTNNPDSLQMAIIKADKLLDRAMREYGVSGTTMGERLKARRGLWTHEDAIWSAHKLRNQIAHESRVTITTQTFKRAMAAFEQALKDLGAL
ncbi:hypothetical protein FBF32_03065 [Candidatus Saccharibacteria bacterium oral taxon 488]|jgi:hypothetical protein|nr:hypothetical protein FBF32_03065 [Candidatus Saccharibacteria bacterium oral taxon 488]QJU10268.1 hypothetical protein FBF26_03275 [Candidatus Saccharibacteria bacterium oral taxon 488]